MYEIWLQIREGIWVIISLFIRENLCVMEVLIRGIFSMFAMWEPTTYVFMEKQEKCDYFSAENVPYLGLWCNKGNLIRKIRNSYYVYTLELLFRYPRILVYIGTC